MSSEQPIQYITPKSIHSSKSRSPPSSSTSSTSSSSSSTSVLSLSPSRMFIPNTMLFFTDLEMTGLDADKDKILELYMAVTDSYFNVVDEIHLVFTCDSDILENMNDWCIQNHSKKDGRGISLLDEVYKSRLTLQQGELDLVKFIQKHLPNESTKAVLAGCSVHHDRLFLLKHMPKLNEYVSHRVFDVTTLIYFFKDLCPTFIKQSNQKIPKSTVNHRALEDTLSVIQLLKFYVSCCQTHTIRHLDKYKPI